MPEGSRMFTYCVFCETAKAYVVSEMIRQRIGCRTLSPMQVQHAWVKGGGTKDIARPLLPGYVFLYSEEKLPMGDVYASASGIIRCLSNTAGEFELSGADEQFALMLLEKNGIIGKTEVYQEGQRIRIRDGAFLGVTATNLKVERRLSRMQIEIPFANRPVRTWVEYEIVEPEEAK